MLHRVASKEYADLRQDPRLRWSLIIVYALFVMALFTGYRYYSQTHRQHEQAQRASYQQWLNQGEKSPHSAAHYGFYAYKPVPLLALIDKGMDDYLGNAVWLEAHKQNAVKEKAAQDAADLARFGSLTVGFVWQFLLPLVIILLTFNAITKERESGTLRMLLATETSGTHLVLGKGWAILKTILLLFFLPMSGISVLAMWLAGGGGAMAESLPGLGSMVIFYTIFLALITAFALLVSVKAKSSGVALVALLGFWTFGAFFVPRMGGSFAKSVYSTPSSFAFTEQVTFEKENGIDGHNPSNKFNKELEASTLKQYGVDSISQLPVSFAAISLQASENRDWVIFDKNYGHLFETFRQQNRLLAAINILSPVLVMRNLSQGFAETDVDKQIEFTNQAERLRRTIQKTMNDDMKIHGAGKDYDYKAHDALWQKIPAFSYARPGIGFVFGNQIISLAALAVWSGAITWLLLRAAKNLKP